MKSNFKNNIELLFENKKKPSLKILLEEDEDKKSDKEEKEKEESKSDDPFGFAQEEETDEETPEETSEEIPSEENKQLSDSEKKEVEMELAAQAASVALGNAEDFNSERNKYKEKLKNPIDSIIEFKKYKLKNLLFEESKDPGNQIVNQINTFLKKNQNKIHDLELANKKELKGYDIEVNDLLNKSIKAVKEFEKKIHPADIILYDYEKKIVEFAPIDEINDMLDEFRKEFCKRVKEETKYTDYERPEFYAGSNSNYNNGVVGQKSG